jgi:tyrosyl-tRNA synthetase
MFGKLMSVSDELMWRYFDLLSFRSLQQLQALRAEVDAGDNPRDTKMALADEIVSRFHGAAAAAAARESFIGRHRHGEVPADLPEQVLVAEGAGLGIGYVLQRTGLTSSTSEALRMLRQGAVRIDGERAEDPKLELPAGGGSHVLQVGKRRFARVRIEADEKT